MTFTEEYLPDDGIEQDEIGNYPTAFGITFTPQVSGIAFGLLGLLASLYLAMQWLMPTYSEYQKLKADERSKQEQVDLAKSGDTGRKFQSLEAQFQEKQTHKSQILALFANEKTLDTILLDINKLIKSRKVELTGFQPQGTEPVIINDSSLGAEVNNKLKRQSFTVQIKGGFEQTQAVIRDLERLQPLILFKNFNTQVQEGNMVAKFIADTGNRLRMLPIDNQQLNTSFTMDVIMTLTPEELAKLAPPPEQQQPPPAGEQKPDESKK